MSADICQCYIESSNRFIFVFFYKGYFVYTAHLANDSISMAKQ